MVKRAIVKLYVWHYWLVRENLLLWAKWSKTIQGEILILCTFYDTVWCSGSWQTVADFHWDGDQGKIHKRLQVKITVMVITDDTELDWCWCIFCFNSIYIYGKVIADIICCRTSNRKWTENKFKVRLFWDGRPVIAFMLISCRVVVPPQKKPFISEKLILLKF